MKPLAVTITEREHAELLPVEAPAALADDQVRGRTLASLISPGTELAWNYQGQGATFPSTPGYSAVFEVDETGCAVTGLEPGTHAFCMGGHRSVQQCAAADVLRVPQGLTPEKAVLARLMGVSMTTLMTTRARPGDTVLVTGAGPVGYLCAHLFRLSGYEVYVVEPNERRRRDVRYSGIGRVFGSVEGADGLTGNVALVVDCSGHEQAVLDGARVVRRGGEVVLVGVPWKRHTVLTAHELLDVVFHRYVVLRSGWEWELPRESAHHAPH
ncbi:MAG: zinc-binding dehydrogenase, partial [Chitinivibrionales bacterium]|nr:zinc-binding dehydrogenase [Chitinivibrionales bacterium]